MHFVCLCLYTHEADFIVFVVQIWAMKRQTVTGKLNCHKTTTGVILKILFVPSNFSAKLYSEKAFWFEIWSSFLSFFSCRYERRKWVSKTAELPNPLDFQNDPTFHNSAAGTIKTAIPKKARKYSLEEDVMNEHMSQVAPTTRPAHGVCCYFILIKCCFMIMFLPKITDSCIT